MNRSKLAIAAIRLLFTSLSILLLLAIATIIDLGQALHKALNNYVDSCEIQYAPSSLLPARFYPEIQVMCSAPKDTGSKSPLIVAESPTVSSLEPGSELTIRQLKAIAKEKRIPKYSKLTKAELLTALAT